MILKDSPPAPGVGQVTTGYSAIADLLACPVCRADLARALLADSPGTGND
ncbi:MAG: hypothetical protein WD944_10775 [Steroidobacteraceae bacterium]